MTDDEFLADLLVRWEDGYEQGREATAEELCPSDRPLLLPRLVAGIADLKRVGWLVRQSGSVASTGRQRPRPSPRRTGDQPLPGYVLEHQLGSGAFGEVWSARTKTFRRSKSRTVAIKFVTGHDDETDHRRVWTEAQGIKTVACIKHDFILSILMYRMIGKNTLAIVSELADSDLSTHIHGVRDKTGWFSAFEGCLSLFRDAAQGLDHLRDAHNLQHGDVKPANLLVVGGRCKVGDFGTVVPLGRSGGSTDGPVVLCTPAGTAARYRTSAEIPWSLAMRPGATLYTAAGGFTPRYASPEALSGQISRSTDQYSLAVSFCDLVFQTLPFAGAGGDQAGSHRRGDIVLDFLPLPWVPIVAKALAPRPEDRFASCTAFVNQLSLRFREWRAGVAPTFTT
jgi:serine/threonine protein kinase